ncbi:MAG: HAD family hydrolase, partial [Nannocystaceae bacterium]
MSNSEIAPLELSRFLSTQGSVAAQIELVATDVDGTLTRGGVMTRETLQSIAALTDAGVRVVPVSGRPAGEVLGLCRYLPGVREGIAENGLISVVPDEPLQFLGAPTDVERLRDIGEVLNRDHAAGLRRAADAFCRVGDVAYERDGRDVPELLRLRAAAEAL